MEFLVGLVVGLIVGWNVLPQPAFVKKIVDKVATKLGFKKDESVE